MSRVSQRNVPIRPKNNEQIQTDVNLISFQKIQNLQLQLTHLSTQPLSFINQSWMLPFSDYYLLSQLNSIIDKLKTSLGTQEQYQTRKIVDDLASKIHGLLARELMVSDQHAGYYDILMQKQKQITKLTLKYGHFQKKITNYTNKIQQLERQINNLRTTLKIYQTNAEQNQLYKTYFKQIKQLTTNSKKIQDLDKLLTQKILPKIRQLQINLIQISKNAGRSRSNKQKAAISKYAIQLDNLYKMKQLDWQTLSNSAAAFFTGLQHLNDDDWIQKRLNLAQAYNQLNTRHIALLSLVKKNVQQLLKRDPNFKNLTEISEFIKQLQKQNQYGYQSMIVNGWIGLGVMHCHRIHGNEQQIEKLNALVLLFQTQIRKLLDKYPQLNQSISIELRQFLSTHITSQVSGGDPLSWIRQILVRETEVIHVDNVYNYYSKTDKQNLYYSRVLLKSLVDELHRISQQHKIDIQLDEGILQLLKTQAIDGIKIDDVIALFRPTTRVCQMPVTIDKPTYIPHAQTIGVPLKQQTAVIVSDTSHFAVNLQQGVPYRKQIPYQYATTTPVQVPVTIQKAYPVETKIVQQVIKFEEKVSVVKVPVDQQKFIQVIQESPIETKQQIIVTQTIQKQVKVPYHTSQIQTKQIEVQKQIPKNIYKQLSKIIKVQQTVPVVYKQNKYQIIQKPIHHIITQKQIQFIKIQKPIIQRLEVAKTVQLLVQKPIYYPNHCDCQKPQPVIVQIQKPIYKQIPKQIIVQKCHFVQPNVQQRIVQIACHSQVPIYKQIIKQQPVFIQKMVPFRTIQQKLVVVQKQTPFWIQHFTPVQLIIQKPVIVRDIKHVPVQVQQPVPIYIQKIVPKVVQVFRDKIVQKIVQVPRVQIIQKIVQKIVTIPRIVQRIVTVPQLIEVPVFIQTPVLEVVELPVQRLVTDIKQQQKIIQVKVDVLKIQKSLETVQKIQYEQVKKIIEVQPQFVPQVQVQKIVKIIQQKPVQIYIDRFVDRVIQVKQVIPIQQRVQVPIQVQIPVQIITNKPIFYKQPVVQIDVQRVQRDKLVQVQKQTIKIQQIQKPYIQIQKQIVELPGETIIVKQPQLHIVQIQKQNVVTARDIQQKPVNHYLDIQKSHLVDQQTFVIPQKQAVFLQKPYAVAIEKPLLMKHQAMVVVQRPDTIIVKTRQGKNQQIIKTITQQKLVAQKVQTRQPITVPQHHYHVLYQQLPPKQFDKTVMVIDEKIKTQQIQTKIQIEGLSKQVITKQIEVPVYMQKIVQKILMLPQIVQIQKKIYMVEEINSLIAKQVNLQTHYQQYSTVVHDIQTQVNQVISSISTGRQINTVQLKTKLQKLQELLRTQSKIPKIVQSTKEVQIIKQKDRPVLVPVYDSQRQKVLHLIISDLIDGIKGLSKVQVQKRFSQRVRNLFSSEFGLSQVTESRTVIRQQQQSQVIEVQSKWKSWLDSYDKHLPSTIPQQKLTQAEQIFICGYDPKQLDSATIKASLQKSSLVNKQRLYQIQKLKSDYTETINQLRLRNGNLQTLAMTQKYYKDLYFNQLMKLYQLLKRQQFDQVRTSLDLISSLKQEVLSSRIKLTSSSIQRHSQQFHQTIRISQSQKQDSQLIQKLSTYENQNHTYRREVQNLHQQNQRLKKDMDEMQLNIPVWNKQSSDQQFNKYNKQWQQKVTEIQNNHFIQLNTLRQQLAKKLTDGSTQGADQFNKAYDQLMNKYSQLSENQKNLENDKRNLVNKYQDKIKDLNKQLLTSKRESQTAQKKNENQRKKLIDDYQKRLTLTSTNQQKQLRKQLQQARRSYDSSQKKSQIQKKKLIDEYESKIRSTATSQGTQQRQLRRELQNIKRTGQNNQKNYENEKKKIINQYEQKLKISNINQQKQLKNSLDKLKKDYQMLLKNTENDKKNIINQYQNKIKKLQDQLDKLRSSPKKSAIISSSQQSQQLGLLRQKIKKLQQELENSKRQVQSYQLSREGGYQRSSRDPGQTYYSSGIQFSGQGKQFQSPQGKFKSGGSRFQQQSGSRKSQGSQQGRKYSKSGQEKQKRQQGEQQFSQSSKISGVSESSYKPEMSMREFIDMRKSQEKDQIINAVMMKIIQKIKDEFNHGRLNCYNPNNILLKNFNPRNLKDLTIHFGQPIKNTKSKTDGLYLAPQVIRGEQITLRSLVFSLAVIWDQAIHSENYYRDVSQIQNLAHEYKVRDTSLNPIIRNTIFEMMSKDPNKRLELKEAQRRLSLQRYIVSQGRAGTTTSRITTQQRKP